MSIFNRLRPQIPQQPGAPMPGQMQGSMPGGMPMQRQPMQLLGPNLPTRDFGSTDPAQLKMAFERARELNGGSIFGGLKGFKGNQFPGILQLQNSPAPPSMVNRFNPMTPSFGQMGNPMGDYISRMQGGQGGYAPPPLPQQPGSIPMPPRAFK